MGRFFLASQATCDAVPFFSLTLSYAWAMPRIGAPVWFWGPQGIPDSTAFFRLGLLCTRGKV
jgi:hypothetical protein